MAAVNTIDRNTWRQLIASELVLWQGVVRDANFAVSEAECWLPDDPRRRWTGAEQTGKHRSNPLVARLAIEALMPVLRNLDFRQPDRRRDNGEVQILCQNIRDR